MLRDFVQSSINLKHQAEANDTITGVLPFASLSLADSEEVLNSHESEVAYSFSFKKDLENYILIEGWIEAVLTLQCQRCLKPMQHAIRSDFCLSPVKTTDEADKLPDSYEAVLMENETISLLRIVEEELILNLPIAPLHEGQCQVSS